MDLKARAYLGALRDAIGGLLGSRGGLWLTGSAALGDDRPTRSDLDIIVSMTIPPAEGGSVR